jgi:hypothetical protein
VVVLYEGRGQAADRVFLRVPGFEKEAAFVAMDVGLDEQDFRQLCRRNLQDGHLLAGWPENAMEFTDRVAIVDSTRSAAELRDGHVTEIARESDVARIQHVGHGRENFLLSFADFAHRLDQLEQRDVLRFGPWERGVRQGYVRSELRWSSGSFPKSFPA